MIIDGDGARDLLSLVVPGIGALEATGNPFEPYRLVDAGGVIVAPVAAYLGDLQACGRPAATQRSYADLCRARHKSAYLTRAGESFSTRVASPSW